MGKFKLIVAVVSLVLATAFAQFVQARTGGDTFPPFPYFEGVPCETTTTDLLGLWVAKDEIGRPQFYVHVSASKFKSHSQVRLLLIEKVGNKGDETDYVVTAIGSGIVTSDHSAVSAVMNSIGGFKKSVWVYIQSLCLPANGERHSVIEIVSSEDKDGKSVSNKFLFEKIDVPSTFSFTE